MQRMADGLALPISGNLEVVTSAFCWRSASLLTGFTRNGILLGDFRGHEYHQPDPRQPIQKDQAGE